jgi:hypothetical protein
LKKGDKTRIFALNLACATAILCGLNFTRDIESKHSKFGSRHKEAGQSKFDTQNQAQTKQNQSRIAANSPHSLVVLAKQAEFMPRA